MSQRGILCSVVTKTFQVWSLVHDQGAGSTCGVTHYEVVQPRQARHDLCTCKQRFSIIKHQPLAFCLHRQQVQRTPAVGELTPQK